MRLLNRAHHRRLAAPGATRADVSAMEAQLCGPLEAYDDLPDDLDPVPPFARLDLHLPGGHLWQVAFHGGDDPGLYHTLATDDGAPLPLSDTTEGLIGWDDVWEQLPILRPEEARPLARAVATATPGLPEAAAFLLLAPLAFRRPGDAPAPLAEAVEAARAGLALGTDAADRTELARRLVPPVGRGVEVAGLYDDARQTVRDAPFRWWREGDAGWRSNARGGFHHKGSSWHPDAFARVDGAFAAGVPMG